MTAFQAEDWVFRMAVPEKGFLKMWTNVAVVAAALSLGFGEGDGLKMFNVRATHGLLGPERTEDKVIPGDHYWVAFEIDGVKPDANGHVNYSMAMDLTNKEGKVIYAQEPKNLDALNSLGGARMQGFTYIQVGLKQPPGEYTIKVTFTDRTSKAVQTLNKKFEVSPADFGLVGLALFADPDGRVPASPQGVVGQPLSVIVSAVGFAREPKRKQQPNVVCEMRILDQNGKPTLAKAFTSQINQDVADTATHLPFPFMMFLNRPGRFRVELRATDLVTGKKGTVSFPIIVAEQKVAGAGENK
jgi:hypothetical protein